MSELRIGSLCSGAGGLDMAVEQVFGATTAWHCEINDAASKVLEYRYPGVPNHRDLTTADWGGVERVDILTGGYPCQPFSHAGRRKGTDDERHIWPHVREAIRRVRPRIAFLENVSGHRSLGFDRVLGDLAEDGMHVRWTSVRASDVGAPHRRERLFILVTPTDADNGARDGEWPRTQSWQRSAGDVALLPTPSAADGGGGHLTRSGARSNELLLPGVARAYASGDLLPTPAAADAERGPDFARAGRVGSGGDDLVTLCARADQERGSRWGKYEPAITYWERLFRAAPSPTQIGSRGGRSLNPAFSEWMMGWPAGWVTEVPDISRNDQLRIIGNGVVPQAAVAALRYLLSVSEVAA